MGLVRSVNVGRESIGAWAGPKGRTGIDKRPVAYRVTVTVQGLVGDCVVRGDDDQAVYAFAREDVGWWEAELDRTFVPGQFGENLSTVDIDLSEALIGERWSVGSAVLEVSGPRTPCVVLEGFWGVPGLIKRFTEHGICGAYLRVRTPGDIGAGDAIEVVHRPAHGLTVAESFRALTTEPELLPKLLTAPELMLKARSRARARVT